MVESRSDLKVPSRDGSVARVCVELVARLAEDHAERLIRRVELGDRKWTK